MKIDFKTLKKLYDLTAEEIEKVNFLLDFGSKINKDRDEKEILEFILHYLNIKLKLKAMTLREFLEEFSEEIEGGYCEVVVNNKYAFFLPSSLDIFCLLHNKELLDYKITNVTNDLCGIEISNLKE